MNTTETAPRSVFAHASLQRLKNLEVPAAVTKAALSPARRCFLELMQTVNFGTIQALELRDAEPVLVPGPRVRRTIKIGGKSNGPRPEVGRPDFVLKAAIVEIFEHFDHIRNGTVTIRVQHGLPTQINVETQS
jgi:hypothetical protein